MLDVDFFVRLLRGYGVTSFFGVPDSLLKAFCAFVSAHIDESHHVIAANEGNAVALACGYYLSTGSPALVYMQNSGLGNCVNPILSLADKEVYGIPFLMLIGWRGEPGGHDEPQHVKQGKITNELLDVLDIKYEILPDNAEAVGALLHRAVEYMRLTRRPIAFIVRKNTFEEYVPMRNISKSSRMRREDALCAVVENLGKDSVVVATTGHISRELFECRERRREPHDLDFLCVGAMGHASSIAMGISLEYPNRRVVCLDGDGACIMHLGSMSIIGSKKLGDFKHIVFNNEAHGSVGGQPTVAGKVDLCSIAKACGYAHVYRVDTERELLKILPEFMEFRGTCFLEIKVGIEARRNLGRPNERLDSVLGRFISAVSPKDQ